MSHRHLYIALQYLKFCEYMILYHLYNSFLHVVSVPHSSDLTQKEIESQGAYGTARIPGVHGSDELGYKLCQPQGFFPQMLTL